MIMLHFKRSLMRQENLTSRLRVPHVVWTLQKVTAHVRYVTHLLIPRYLEGTEFGILYPEMSLRSYSSFSNDLKNWDSDWRYYIALITPSVVGNESLCSSPPLSPSLSLLIPPALPPPPPPPPSLVPPFLTKAPTPTPQKQTTSPTPEKRKCLITREQ